MHRAPIIAKDLKLITQLATQFRSNLSTQINVWATAVTLDNKAKVRLGTLLTPISTSSSIQFVISRFGMVPLPVAAPPLSVLVLSFL
jgi:hypothetical protein